MRRPMVAGNWKMNGNREMASNLISEIDCGFSAELATSVEVLVCPPYVLLESTGALCSGKPIKLGAQNLDIHESGAFTGEISGPMLLECGCEYVIVGHSERRALYGDTDELVGIKTRAASEKGLVPIICVGETQEEREKGVMAKVVSRQLEAVFSKTQGNAFPKALVAYEPVWAIGTGLTASEAQAQEVHALIRERLSQVSSEVADSTRILYGGSVKPDNAEGLFGQPDIDGGLIGGASLHAQDFIDIISAAKS